MQAGKRSRDDKVFYRSLLKPSPHLFLSTTDDDPRAELHFRKRSCLERQLSRIDGMSRGGVEELAYLFEELAYLFAKVKLDSL
jgi:hypothetical protein